jgi:hypothetical protein
MCSQPVEFQLESYGLERTRLVHGHPSFQQLSSKAPQAVQSLRLRHG